jgi:hypothetical protein
MAGLILAQIALVDFYNHIYSALMEDDRFYRWGIIALGLASAVLAAIVLFAK